MKNSKQLKRQAGFSMVSLVMLIIVISLANLGLAVYQKTRASQVMGGAIGGQGALIKTALDNYLAGYGSNIVAQKLISNGTTTVANPLAPTLAELYGLGFLTAPMGPPINGGSWVIFITPQPSTCTLPGACNLAAGVYATVPLTQSSVLSGIDGTALAAAVSQLNGDAGYSEVNTPTVITGAGGWTRPNPLGSVAGIFYAISGYGAATYTALKNVGDACTTPGAVATSTTGQQLICRGSNYVSTLNALSNYRDMAKVLVKDGDTVLKPTCETGGTPAYSFEMTQTAVDVAIAPPLQALYEKAQDLGGSWKVVIHMKDRGTTDTSANPYFITAIFHVQCYYP